MAANIARFILCGRASQQKCHLLVQDHTGTPRFSYNRIKTIGKALASFSSSSSSEQITQFPSSYQPCLLLSQKLIPFFDGSSDHTVSYTFYSLKDDKIMQKMKEVVLPSDLDYLLPKDFHLFGSSHGWLAYHYDKTVGGDMGCEEPFYLINPSLPFRETQIIYMQQYYHRKKFALSFSPQFQPPCNDDSNATPTVVFLDRKGRPEFHDFDPSCSEETFEECCYGYFDDILYFKEHQKFYSLQYGDLILGLTRDENKEWKSYEALPDLPCLPINIRWIGLVESSGNLLLVVRESSKVCNIDVLKVNFEEQKWEPVKCLGDHALFIGDNDFFSLCTLEFPYLKRNSIYFINKILDLESGSYSYLADGVVDQIKRTSSISIPSPCNWVMVDVGAI